MVQSQKEKKEVRKQHANGEWLVNSVHKHELVTTGTHGGNGKFALIKILQ